MTFSQARKRLRALITEKYTRTQLATDIGCDLGHLSHVLDGHDKSFGLKHAPRIQSLFGIPAAAWYRPRKNKAA